MASRIVQYFADKLKTVKDYPITLTKAVYDDNGNRLDNKLSEINNNLGSKIVYNEETDMLDIYVNGDVIGSLPCNFQTYYLYKDGNVMQNITGGWGKANWSFGDYTLGNFSVTDNNIILQASANSVVGLYGTQNAIDLTNFTKLCIEGNITSVVSTGTAINLCTTKEISGSTEIGRLNKVTNKIVFDISTYSGFYYIAMFNFGSAYYNTGNISKIWLE